MKPRMRLSSSIEHSYDRNEQISSSSKSLDISDRMKKLLTSPLIKRKLTSQMSTKVFGAPIDTLAYKVISDDESDVIPFILFRLCHYIEDSGGLCQEGLFRISGNAKLIEKLKNLFDSTGDAPLESEGDIPSASGLLKLFLRELPKPLIGESSLFLDVIKDFPNDRERCIDELKSLVSCLPNENFVILKYLANFLTKVAFHEGQNRMNPSSLGIVFGPNIFRISADNYQGLREQAMTNQIVSLFITNYKDIFITQNYKKEAASLTKQFLPLSVEIPCLELNPSEGSLFCNTPEITFTFCRKRKERKCSVHRSSSEERPTGCKEQEFRRCNSQDNVLKKVMSKSLDGIKDEKLQCDVSPKPSEPKRRELESKFLLHKETHQFLVPNHQFESKTFDKSNNEKDSLHGFSGKTQFYQKLETSDNVSNSNIKENLPENTMTSKCKNPEERHYKPLVEIISSENFENNNNNNYDHNSSSTNVLSSIKDSIPSLDFNTLHQNAGTNEPLLSEHRYSWPHVHCSSENDNLAQVHLSNNALLFLKKANSYEAPLSPSAYRGYLNYRNQHLDSTIPPSPPVDQEEINYGKKDFNDNPGVRIINKRIHILKKKIKQFEQDFEKEHGYRPSLEQKINSEIANSYIKELNKLRKDLKELKGDSQIIDYTEIPQCDINISDFDSVQIDRTAKLKEIIIELEEILTKNRLMNNRPENLDEMKPEQILEEKLLLQKELLRFESIYGRPTNKAEREIVRSVYDRYRAIKRIVSKLSLQKSGSKDLIELQPIIEHETMNFIPSSNSKIEYENETSPIKFDDYNIQSKGKKCHLQYGNFHEMPLAELKRQLQNSIQEKRNLRCTLRDFERDFQKRNGRRVEKEDKVNMETYYTNYKHIKGKVRLLEALVSKHQSQRFK